MPTRHQQSPESALQTASSPLIMIYIDNDTMETTVIMRLAALKGRDSQPYESAGETSPEQLTTCVECTQSSRRDATAAAIGH